VPCPPHSSGASVVYSCACDAGYTGSIGKIQGHVRLNAGSWVTAPAHDGSCEPVPCPVHCLGHPGRSSGLRVLHSRSVFYGVCMGAQGA
jgi:hypothetical protein